MEAPPYSAASVDVLRLPGRRTERDRVAVEEPLEIRIGGRPVAVTMRTPGHDEELALGFCLSEGLRPAGARLPDDLAANTVEVAASGFDPGRLQRSFYTSSSCGVCGTGALDVDHAGKAHSLDTGILAGVKPAQVARADDRGAKLRHGHTPTGWPRARAREFFRVRGSA